MGIVAKRVSKKMKEARIRNNYTQKYVAEQLGLSEGQYAHYEKNRAEPSADTAFQICKFYGESFDDWLGLTNKTELKPFPNLYNLSGSNEIIRLDDLPEDARQSMIDYFEFLFAKYKEGDKEK